MNKLLKLTGVSMLALVAITNANAAGYTCEELIEYTSCEEGYYLLDVAGTCPDGYTYGSLVSSWEEAYRTWESEEEFLEACEEWGFGCCSAGEEECSGYKILGAGCYKNWECEECETYFQSDFVQATTSGTKTCSECPAGSSCAGGTADKVTCAAGTYQPDKKQTTCLTTPKNNYSLAGATNYSACPSTGLTDKDGKTVTAETASSGATSIMACYIGPDWYFENTKGIYHFTSNCNAFDLETATEAEKTARCQSMGGIWVQDSCLIDIEYPTTESTCYDFDFCDWQQDDPEDEGVCNCECSEGVEIDLENGQIDCYEA